jgi:hypothetical protein
MKLISYYIFPFTWVNCVIELNHKHVKHSFTALFSKFDWEIIIHKLLQIFENHAHDFFFAFSWELSHSEVKVLFTGYTLIHQHLPGLMPDDCPDYWVLNSMESLLKIWKSLIVHVDDVICLFVWIYDNSWNWGWELLLQVKTNSIHLINITQNQSINSKTLKGIGENSYVDLLLPKLIISKIVTDLSYFHWF